MPLIDTALLQSLAVARNRVAVRDPAGERWLLGVGAAALALLAIALASGGYHAWFASFNAAAAALPAALWQNVTFTGDVLLTLGIVLALAHRQPHVVWAVAIALIIGTLLTHVPKALLNTARPAAVLDPSQFHLIGPRLRTEGFPSGHSLNIFGIAGILIYYVRSAYLRAGLLVAAVLVGFSRVAVGAHWPVDVFAGAAGGALTAWAAVTVVRHWQWGLRLRNHRALVALLAVCAGALIHHTGGYSQAAYLAAAVGVSSLALGAFQYLVRPLAARARWKAHDT